MPMTVAPRISASISSSLALRRASSDVSQARWRDRAFAECRLFDNAVGVDVAYANDIAEERLGIVLKCLSTRPCSSIRPHSRRLSRNVRRASTVCSLGLDAALIGVLQLDEAAGHCKQGAPDSASSSGGARNTAEPSRPITAQRGISESLARLEWRDADRKSPTLHSPHPAELDGYVPSPFKHACAVQWSPS